MRKLFAAKGSKFLCAKCDEHLLTASIDIFYGDDIHEELFTSASVRSRNGVALICPNCGNPFGFTSTPRDVIVVNPDTGSHSES